MPKAGKGKQKPEQQPEQKPDENALLALTPMQKAFVKAYLADPQRNATRAAIVAGYSENCAAQQAHENLRKPEIIAAIEVEIEARYKRLDITGDRIAAELMLLGTFDPADAFDDNGNLLPVKKMPEHVRRALTGHSVFEVYSGRGTDRVQTGATTNLKWADKRPALELLLKMQGKVIDKHELTGKGGGPIKTQDMNQATTAELLAELEALRGKQKRK